MGSVIVCPRLANSLLHFLHIRLIIAPSLMCAPDSLGDRLIEDGFLCHGYDGMEYDESESDFVSVMVT